MKLAFKHSSLVTRLATLAAVTLFSQQALAVGTAAGTDISNQATVDYDVGTVPQATVTSAAVVFRVDNRVDFTLVANPDPIVATLAMVGDSDAVVEFMIQNTGNQTQDYFLSVANAADAASDGVNSDTGDMNNLRIIVDNNGDGVRDASDTDDFVDELAADAPARLVWVLADTDTPIPNQLLNGDFAIVELTADTYDAGAAGLGSETLASASDDPAVEDVVLAVNATLGQSDLAVMNTYQLESAALNITKTRSLISDPFNAAPANAFYIPGAVVEYLITVENTSATTEAQNVSITDILTSVAIVPGAVGGQDVEIINDALGAAVAISPCTADDADTDGDGCGLVTNSPTSDTLTVGTGLGINVAAATSLTIRFHVTID